MRRFDTDFSNPSVAAYYRHTRWQYRLLWAGKRSLALHYGFRDDGVTSHTEALERLNEVLADRVEIGPEDHVLDAGCGWGGSSIWLALNRGATVHGINIDEEQIDKARAEARLVGASQKTTFSKEDYNQTSFPDESFSVIWATESVCYSRDKAAFCKEAYRLLKPGGRLVLSDFFRSSRHLAAEKEEILQAWIHRWIVEDLATLDEFQSHLAAAGFDRVEVRDATENIETTSRSLWLVGLLTSPLAVLFRLLRIHSRLQDANWKSSIYQYRALRQGAWRYGIFSAHK